MKDKIPLVRKVLWTVRENPGISGTELREQFKPMYSPHAVSGILTRLSSDMKLIENRGPAGTRWSEWYPVEHGPIDQTWIDEAEWLLEEMNKITKSERVNFLARHLQELAE